MLRSSTTQLQRSISTLKTISFFRPAYPYTQGEALSSTIHEWPQKRESEGPRIARQHSHRPKVRSQKSGQSNIPPSWPTRLHVSRKRGDIGGVDRSGFRRCIQYPMYDCASVHALSSELFFIASSPSPLSSIAAGEVEGEVESSQFIKQTTSSTSFALAKLPNS